MGILVATQLLASQEARPEALEAPFPLGAEGVGWLVPGNSKYGGVFLVAQWLRRADLRILAHLDCAVRIRTDVPDSQPRLTGG